MKKSDEFSRKIAGLTLLERGRLAKMNPSSLTDDDAVLLVEIIRRKVLQLNALFRAKEWTPQELWRRVQVLARTTV